MRIQFERITQFEPAYDDQLPPSGTLASAIMEANQEGTVEDALVFSQKIISANDREEFNEAWSLLKKALGV